SYPRILLALSDPIDLLAGFMAACVADCPVFLGNPHWSSAEWYQAIALAQPHQIWGTLPIPALTQPLATADARERGWIMIPTGGSSGHIKFAIHTWATLSASVEGFHRFWSEEYGPDFAIDSCCVLPLYHVSGLMQFMRSLLTQGNLLSMPFADSVNGQSVHPDLAMFLAADSAAPQDYFLSLVPTQLQRLLQHPERLPWLRRFRTIFLGGAPAWTSLLDQARQEGLNLAPTYGMTETAAQIATLKPQAFLQGNTSVGQLLPHVCLNGLHRNETGEGHPITIQSAALFQGYYPCHRPCSEFLTDDLGYLDTQGDLHLVGRRSRKIISGGENIFPEAVEAALLATGLVRDVYVVGTPDEQWGEAVTAIYVPIKHEITVDCLTAALTDRLSRYKHPKHWIAVSELPRNAQGKVNWQGETFGWKAKE
ncbi:MAG: 2-succinylbenzoate--CoA ligase, partial [Thermosynechococcaceae cyanobacterium]